MLRFFTILMLFCLASNANAQTYVPFPTSADTAVWLSEVGIVTSPPSNFYKKTIKGDTIINNKTYSKIYSSFHNQTTLFFQKAIREEDKVIYTWDDSVEVVLYDFNAQVGDTINWFGVPNNELTYISLIDSINIDGDFRKRFEIICEYSWIPSTIYVTEGFGSSEGLFPRFGTLGDFQQLVCFTLNNETIYTEPNNPNCIVSSTKQIQQTDNISINPNPTSDFLNIDFETNEERTFRLFNQLGQVVLSGISNDAQLILNVAHLPKGFYVLAIQTEKGTFTKKVVKE